MWGIINFTNVMFNESMGMRGERCRKKLEEIISSKLPKFDEKSNLHIQEAQQTPCKISTKEITPGYIIVKTLKDKNRENTKTTHHL